MPARMRTPGRVLAMFKSRFISHAVYLQKKNFRKKETLSINQCKQSLCWSSASIKKPWEGTAKIQPRGWPLIFETLLLDEHPVLSRSNLLRKRQMKTRIYHNLKNLIKIKNNNINNNLLKKEPELNEKTSTPSLNKWIDHCKQHERKWSYQIYVARENALWNMSLEFLPKSYSTASGQTHLCCEYWLEYFLGLCKMLTIPRTQLPKKGVSLLWIFKELIKTGTAFLRIIKVL